MTTEVDDSLRDKIIEAVNEVFERNSIAPEIKISFDRNNPKNRGDRKSEFCYRLLILRRKLNYTQQQIADAAGMSLRTYQNYERGDREPSLSKITKIASILGITVDALFVGNDKEFVDSSDTIFNRLKSALCVRTDTQLANHMGVRPTTFGTYRSRGTIPYKRIIILAIKRGIDLNWLFSD